MKQVTIKVPAALVPVFFALIFLLIGGLVGAALGIPAAQGSPARSYLAVDNGTLTGCVGGSTDSALKLGGRAITASAIIQLSSDGTCGENETAVTWNIQGEQGAKGDPTYVRTILVSPVITGGSAFENQLYSGQALVAAMDKISSAVPAPSADYPYLLKIEPGIYDLRIYTLKMIAYVDIEGSGQDSTFINSYGNDYSEGSFGSLGVAVEAASNSELRMLTVTNILPGFQAAAVYVPGSVTGFSLSNATLQANVGGSNQGSAKIGLIVGSGATNIKVFNSTLNGSGVSQSYGIYNNGGTIQVQSSNISSSSTAINNKTDSTITVQNSIIKGDNLAIVNVGGTVKVATSQIIGQYDNYPFSTNACIGDYDADYAARSC